MGQKDGPGTSSLYHQASSESPPVSVSSVRCWLGPQWAKVNEVSAFTA